MRPLFITLISFALSLGGMVRAELPNEESLLKRGGPDAESIILKAHGILTSAQVLASRAVGAAGVPTSNCWALTVIVKHDPEARKFLNALFQNATTPEQRLYAIAGLVSLDKAEGAKFAPDRISKIADQAVHTEFGCIFSESTFGIEAANLINGGASHYLFDQLPSLYETVESSRFLMPMK